MSYSGVLLSFGFLICCYGFSQNEKLPLTIFEDNKILQVQLGYNFKEIKKKTNDSTYLESTLFYLSNDKKFELSYKARKRGNFRLKTCFFPPLLLKFDKESSKGSVFAKNRKVKIVMNCLLEKEADDLVVKEFIAYKLYEIVSPFHFKSRLLDIKLIEQRKKRKKNWDLKGFFIEDIKDLAKRTNSKVLKRGIHPLQQDGKISIINAFFQCMIGNTDFSTGYQHNEKLIFKNGRSYPVPYDFDMSGLVNASYAVVSQLNGDQLPIEKVTDRLYRGFIRDRKLILEVRELFLNKKEQLLQVFDDNQIHLSQTAYLKSKNYVNTYFAILEDDDKFEDMILASLREKLPNLTENPN